MKKIPAVLFLLAMTVGACKKNTGANTQSSDVFPNKVGDHWHYLVKDTTMPYHIYQSSTQYYVDVNIVGMTTLINGPDVSIWQFRYPDHTDTEYVSRQEDTILFLGLPGPYVAAEYLFPFSTGLTWRYVPFSLMEVSVAGQESIDAGSNHFQGAWEISGNSGLPNDFFRVDEWFVDHIGFVRKVFNPYGQLIPTTHILDWLLVSYALH